MKKSSLKDLKLIASDILQREQLKSIFGGNPPDDDQLPPGHDDPKCWATCNCGGTFKVDNCSDPGICHDRDGVLYCGCVV